MTQATRRNALDAYARRTINAAARDYDGALASKRADRRLNLKAAAAEAARGTDTGWWGELIYTVDVYRMADRNRRAIADALSRWIEDTDHNPAHAIRADDPTPFQALAACTLAPSFKRWERSATGHDDSADARADALAWGLRFAVDYFASEYAAELDV